MKERASHARVGASLRECGSALTWALLFVVVTAGAIVSHTIYLMAERRSMDVRYRQDALVQTLARSGVMDALAWFRRQGQQPVQQFAPVHEPEATPPRIDTVDPALGLVREFEIRGNLWGRYEVRTDEVDDISGERGADQPGTVWAIGSRAFVYRLRDPGVPYDQAPNEVVAVTRIESEVRGIPVEPPASAAVVIPEEGMIKLGPMAVLRGGKASAIAFRRTPSDGGEGPLAELTTAVIDPGAVIEGSPAQLGLADVDLSPQAMFSMPRPALRTLSDRIAGNGKIVLRGRWRDVEVIFSDGDLWISSPGPVLGRVLIVTGGDLHIDLADGSALAGVIHAGGDARLDGELLFRGTIVTEGVLEVGLDGQRVEIVYDPDALEKVIHDLGAYRLSRSFVPPP